MQLLYDLNIILIDIFLVIPILSDYELGVINHKKLHYVVELIPNCEVVATWAGDYLEELFVEESLGVLVGVEHCGEFGHGGGLWMLGYRRV